MKAAIVDVAQGEMATERFRLETPRPATPETMALVFDRLVDRFGWQGPIGCTFPGVVRSAAVVETAANLDPSWIGVDAADLFGSAPAPVTMINDADAAGVAEMAFGAGAGSAGVVFMLTIGTGLGTAIFADGTLVPNTELGHLEIDGADAEELASSRARETLDLPLDVWAARLQRYLDRVEFLLSPDVMIIGGGISKHFDEFAGHLRTRATLVPAGLLNSAGIVGAAIVASRR